MSGFSITRQVLFDGFISGLATAIVAVGIVLIYRATRVINFAVGTLGIIGAALFSLAIVNYNFPFWLAFVLCLVAGVAVAMIAELAVIRRLFTAPRVIVLVATIGIGQLALAGATALPDIKHPLDRYPVALGGSWTVSGVQVGGAEVQVLVVVPIVVLALGWFLARTAVGKTVQASADNAELARLSGINPKLVSTLVWGIAGLLSTLSLMLIAGLAGTAGNVISLGPDTLVRALAAAVIGGMKSFPRTLVAAIVIGVLDSVIGFNYLDQPGLIDLLILIAILVAVWFQSRTRAETATFSFTAKPRPIPDRLKSVWWIRLADRSGVLVLLFLAILLPLVVTLPSRQLLYATILAYAICGVSLTVLTGWAGQISLGQMAFAGIGALFAANLTQGISLNIGWGNTSLLDVAFTGNPFWLSILISAASTAVLAALIGVGSLRVRGLLLAVTTFAFALAAQQYFYNRPILNGHSDGDEPFTRGPLFGLGMTSQRRYYYALLVVLVFVLWSVARLRRSGIGRRMIAVRDNSDAAAAYTVSPMRARMQAFALAGGIAGLGGALLAGVVQSVPYNEQFFLVNDSLVLVSLVVIGGMGSTIGPVLGALWIIGLPAFAPGNDLVPLVTSSVGLLVLLLYFPSGLVGIAYKAREAFLLWAEQRVPVTAAIRPPAVPKAAAHHERAEIHEGDTLVTSGLTVRYGGHLALNDVSVRVGADEIVGLIGANGAGKSTLMNAVGGFCPSQGRVELLGKDVSGASATRRATLSLGRTFQAARLFPELTVRETVQVALESRRRTGLISTVLVLPHAVRSERAKRAEADEILSFLGLGRYADQYVSNLSTGTRRIVELAGLLALDARVMCLDEPTAGVAQRETEAFGPLLLQIRKELRASMLVIEHDMPMIMGISDRVYCLEAGQVIAEGDPTAMRNDPRVIASYLGTDERAVARSGLAPTGTGTTGSTTTEGAATAAPDISVRGSHA
jgi:ABC-type branched-subunit amino acid transport system ATPase component/ABC-type branched-subunit amino acid transport system permease subunit